MTRRSQNQQISRIFENYKKSAKTDENEAPDTLEMKFRPADAANHVNREGSAPGVDSKPYDS